MRDLEVGDKVLATKDDGQLFFDDVAFFGHKMAGKCERPRFQSRNRQVRACREVSPRIKEVPHRLVIVPSQAVGGEGHREKKPPVGWVCKATNMRRSRCVLCGRRRPGPLH